jgi:hypothetical protein
MEMICTFTQWPELHDVDDPAPPFPDITPEMFFEVADLLSQLKKTLPSTELPAFEKSYQRIFAPFWSGFDDEDEEEEAGEMTDEGESDEDEDQEMEDEEPSVVYSPSDADSITAGAALLPSVRLRQRIVDSNLIPSESWDSAEDFFSILDDIVDTFREAAAQRLGVVITVV